MKLNINRKVILAFVILHFSLFIASCGYRIVGSTHLPFDSIAVRSVQNMTYEPKLEEKLHVALSREFMTQGIKLAPEGHPAALGTVPESGIVLEARITAFESRTIAVVGSLVKEQEIIMLVDVSIMDKNTMSRFEAVKSPIQITYESTGTVSESYARKERAIDKACAEIAKEIAGRVIIKYVK